MLEYSKKKREAAFDSWVSKVKATAKAYMLKSKRRIISLCILAALCAIAYVYVIPCINPEHLISFKRITPKNLTKISPEAFRKMIGYDYEEDVYIKDTAEIRIRLEASSMVFGNVKFFVNLIPFYELEVELMEASPLFVLMPQSSDSMPVVYSDKGKVYPYSTNVADLPVVDAKEAYDIALATKFLIDMRKNDALLYSRISQLIPSEDRRQITVFFNDVDFKTKFSLESDYWKIAFKHYRQLTRNMQILNINSIAVLDLRFRQLAYTIEKEERL
jgi:cell division septal protein FtsQ